MQGENAVVSLVSERGGYLEDHEFARRLRCVEEARVAVPALAQDVEFLLDEAGFLRYAQRLSAAAEVLRTCVEIAPDNGRAKAELGFALAWRKRHEEATPYLEEAVEVEPALARGWLYLGVHRIEHLGDAAGGIRALMHGDTIPVPDEREAELLGSSMRIHAYSVFLDLLNDDPDGIFAAGLAMEPAERREVLSELRRRGHDIKHYGHRASMRFVGQFGLAQLCARAGDREEALALMDELLDWHQDDVWEDFRDELEDGA